MITEKQKEIIQSVKHLKWEIIYSGNIRCVNGDCPIIAAAIENKLPMNNFIDNNWYWDKYYEDLGLSYREAIMIIRAADNLNKETELREYMIKELINDKRQ